VTGDAVDDAAVPADDPVARNRSMPQRTVPGREPLGAAVTARVALATAVAVLLATAVLLAVLLR